MPFSDYILLIVGFVAGIYFFFKGFRVYREYRVLADIPEMPIRSISMGLVEVHGQAVSDQRVTSPVTQTPCLFYKVDIEKWGQTAQASGGWVHYKTDTNGVKFYLQDRSGKALVDARSAEFDLLRTTRRETRPSPRSLLATLATDQKAYLKMGRTDLKDEALENYVKSLGGGGEISVSSSLQQVAALASFNLGGGQAGGYRLTEYVILPDHWYDVTGTCVENPQPKDEHDRNMIVKGQNEPTFMISWRGEKEIEGTLRHRAAKYIFGGAAVSIGSLAFLLVKFGWF